MSGALSALTGSIPGASAALAALDGLTRTAAWRGVTFTMLDSQDSVGRRIVRFLFPGRDDSEHEDLGALDGTIAVTALLIGDDYVRRAQRLRVACRQAGPGTLVHPWMGPMQVVLAKPAEFKFTDSELRICRVTLQFEPWHEAQAPQQGTLGALLDRLDSLLDQGQLMLAGALAPLRSALAAFGLVDGLLARVGGVWDVAMSGPGSSAARGAAQPALDALTGAVALDTADLATLAAQAGALLAAVPAAVADAADAGPDPAIGPGPAAVAASALSPRQAAGLLLAAVPALAPSASDPAPVAGLLLAAQMQAVAETARAATLIDWDSREEAIVWRDQVDALLAGVGTALAAAAAAQPLVYAEAWRAIRLARAAWTADMHERIGRLAPIRRIQTGAVMSAWEIALAVAGDDPSRIVPALLDLVQRNRVRHPALVPPGLIEVRA